MGKENIPSTPVMPSDPNEVLHEGYLFAKDAENKLRNEENEKKIKILKKICLTKPKSVLLAAASAMREGRPVPQWAAEELSNVIYKYIEERGGRSLDDLLSINKRVFAENTYIVIGSYAYELRKIHDYKRKKANEMVRLEMLYGYSSDEDAFGLDDSTIDMCFNAYNDGPHQFGHREGYGGWLQQIAFQAPRWKEIINEAANYRPENINKAITDYEFRKEVAEFRFEKIQDLERKAVGASSEIRAEIFNDTIALWLNRIRKSEHISCFRSEIQ